MLKAQGNGVQPGLQQCGTQHELSDERAQCGLGFLVWLILCCAELGFQRKTTQWLNSGSVHVVSLLTLLFPVVFIRFDLPGKVYLRQNIDRFFVY